MDTEITVTASGLALSGPLLAGERVSVSVSGVAFAEGAKPTLVLLSRFPDALLASVELTEGDEGAWSGVLDTATRQVGGFFVTARADERRDAVLELIDANGETRDSVARLLVPFGNSALCPSPMHAQLAASVYVAGPPGPQGPQGATGPQGPKGDKGDPGTSIPLPVSVANGGTGATTAAAARANLGAVATTGDEGLTGDYATTGSVHAGSVHADSVIADTDIIVGNTQAQMPDSYVGIAKEGVIFSFDGAATTPVATPGGKQASDPTNTLPVLATTNQIPSLAAPSTDASAQGKAADAKATGDALAGKLDGTGLTNNGGQLAAGDFVTGYSYGFTGGKYVTSPENSGAGLTVGDITDSTSALGAALTAKQDAISDLATIRSGAAAGATAVQPSAMPASETWTFTVDDGQGGTTTVTKQVAVYAAQAQGAGA